MIAIAGSPPAVPSASLGPQRICPHQPVCPSADAPDREVARSAASHPEQGWSLLCNGVIVFEDTGELLPDGRVVEPRRAG